MIVLCAVLSGMEDWVGMEAFAEGKGFFAGSCGAEGGYVAFKCMVFFSVNL